MVYAAVTYRDPESQVCVSELSLALDPSYGATADIAHSLLELCLFGAELPFVVDAQGETWFIPRAFLLSFRTWLSLRKSSWARLSKVVLCLGDESGVTSHP